MLSHKVLTRQEIGRAASYYEDAADDYYEKGGEASEWQGRGAETLGLSGPVESQRFRELLAGRVHLHMPAARGATRQDMNSRIGIDLTFSAPKSVSIQALIGGDPSIVRAHDVAVARALAATEDLAAARKKVNGRSRVERTRNLVVAKFRHETSRERDPQLHTHAVVLNLTRRSDGEWRALRNDEIIKTTRYLGAVYRAELAAELQRAGYALRHEREGFFELAHMDRHQLAAFSRRAEQIERRLAHSGLTLDTASSEEKQKVKLQTRPRKTPTDRDALFREWRERAREVGIDLTKGRDPSDRGRSEAAVAAIAAGAAHVVEEGARRAVRYAIHHLTERQAIMSERELIDVALKHAVGRATLPDIRRAVDRQTATGYLIRESPVYRPVDEQAEKPRNRSAWIALLVEKGLARDGARERVDAAITTGGLIEAERRYTTQTALEREKRILQIEREGRAQLSPIAAREDVQLRLSTSSLNAGQRAAVELITTTPHRMVGVQGYAGTGKSHMLEQAKTIVEEHGYRVIALAPYASHVRVMRECGVEARTLASFLAAREKHLDSRVLLVIDEAGTVPTRQMEQALKLAEQSQARVVLLGDTRQTKAIEAGRPFDQLQDAGMETALMEDIQRQKDPGLRAAVTLAARGEASASLAHVRHIREMPEHEERRAAIAADYAQMPAEERSRTIIVAGTNEARREINRAVRENLGLAGQGYTYPTLTRRDTTQAERAFARNYSPGDFIQPERDYPRRGLERGALYEVTETGPGNRLTVRGEKGQVIQFCPMTYRRLSVYEPERTELAPGDRVRITRNDAALDLANGDRFTVTTVSPSAIALSDGRRQVELSADGPLHLDHAYATTIHSSQGTTSDRVLIDAATKSRTTAKDVYYVAISRAQHEARIYTDNVAELPRVVERENPKYAALDLLRE